MSTIAISFNRTMGHEGLYSNDQDDKGGETYRGISRVHFPDWFGWEIIDDYKKNNVFPENIGHDRMLEHVLTFYNINFFVKLSLHEISEQDIADEIFDTAVNCGRKKAGEITQQALNLLNKNEKLFKDITVDGIIGPVTVSAIEIILNQRFGKEKLLKTLNGYQFCHYKEITEKNPIYEKFFFGWLNRV